MANFICREQFELKKNSQQNFLKLKIKLLGYRCYLTNDCKFSTLDFEKLKLHLASHKINRSEIKINQRISKHISNTKIHNFIFKKQTQQLIVPKYVSSTKNNCFICKKINQQSNIKQIKPQNTLFKNQEFFKSKDNDNTSFKNVLVLQSTTFIGANYKETLTEDLIIQKLKKKILETPQIQAWIKKNKQNNADKLNLVKFNVVKLNAQTLNTEEFIVLRSIVKELNAEEYNAKEFNVNKFDSKKLKDYIEIKLNQLMCKIDKTFKNSKLLINYMKTILDQIKNLRNSSVTKPVPQTMATYSHKLYVKMNNRKQNSSTAKITVKPNTKVTVYKIKNVLTAVPIDPNKSGFYKYLFQELITMDNPPSIQHLKVYRIVNVNNLHCLVEVVNTQTNGHVLLKLEFSPAVRAEIELLDTMPHFMSRSVLMMQTSTMDEEKPICTKCKK